MKGMLFVGEPKGTDTRQLFTIERRHFLAFLLQLHARRFVIKSVYYCSCGMPLYWIVSRGRTFCDGHVCVECSFKDLPGL